MDFPDLGRQVSLSPGSMENPSEIVIIYRNLQWEQYAMNTIYLDNGATSFPKPPAVAQAMFQYMTEVGASINRGVYGSAQAAGTPIQKCCISSA